MKLAACYSAFNSGELLEGSIMQIYEHVDAVVICYQINSNVGNRISLNDLRLVTDLKKLSKVHVIEFIPNLKLNPKENERKKLQMRIDYCKKIGCSHYIGMAPDHYFITEDFESAKEICKIRNVDITFTKMFTYYKKPTFQLTPIEDYLAPFICRIYDNTKVISKNNYSVRVDPSVRIEPANSFHTFDAKTIMLHHFSMVRDDIESKFINAAAAQNWKQKIPGFIYEYNNIKVGDSVSYFKGRKIIEVENYFNIK